MYSEQDHLQGKDPIVNLIYKKLIKEVHKFGTLKVDPKKAAIQLTNRYGFTLVYLRKNCINLEIFLNHKVKSKRLGKPEQVSANRYIHSLQLFSPNELDEEVIAWLKEAYELKV